MVTPRLAPLPTRLSSLPSEHIGLPEMLRAALFLLACAPATATLAAGSDPRTSSSVLAERATEIRNASARSCGDSAATPKPLPLLSSWNVALRRGTFDVESQLNRIAGGAYLLPWVHMGKP